MPAVEHAGGGPGTFLLPPAGIAKPAAAWNSLPHRPQVLGHAASDDAWANCRSRTADRPSLLRGRPPCLIPFSASCGSAYRTEAAQLGRPAATIDHDHSLVRRCVVEDLAGVDDGTSDRKVQTARSPRASRSDRGNGHRPGHRRRPMAFAHGQCRRCPVAGFSLLACTDDPYRPPYPSMVRSRSAARSAPLLRRCQGCGSQTPDIHRPGEDGPHERDGSDDRAL